MLTLFLWFLTRGKALDVTGILAAFVPALVAATAAAAAISWVRIGGESLTGAMIKLIVLGSLFSVVYLAVLRIAFSGPLVRLAEILPARDHIERILMLKKG